MILLKAITTLKRPNDNFGKGQTRRRWTHGRRWTHVLPHCVVPDDPQDLGHTTLKSSAPKCGYKPPPSPRQSGEKPTMTTEYQTANKSIQTDYTFKWWWAMAVWPSGRQRIWSASRCEPRRTMAKAKQEWIGARMFAWENNKSKQAETHNH